MIAGRKLTRLARYDDLLEEEREEVKLALARLTPQESYDRVYRIRRAQQASYQHKLLAKEDWTTPETVTLRNSPNRSNTASNTSHRTSLTCARWSSRSRLRLQRRTLWITCRLSRSTRWSGG